MPTDTSHLLSVSLHLSQSLPSPRLHETRLRVRSGAVRWHLPSTGASAANAADTRAATRAHLLRRGTNIDMPSLHSHSCNRVGIRSYISGPPTQTHTASTQAKRQGAGRARNCERGSSVMPSAPTPWDERRV